MTDHQTSDQERLNRLGEDLVEPVAKAIGGALAAEVVGAVQVLKGAGGIISAVLKGDPAQAAQSSADMASSALSVATGGATSLVAAGYDTAVIAGQRASVRVPTSNEVVRQGADAVGDKVADKVFEAVHSDALSGYGRDPNYVHSRLTGSPLDRLSPEARDGAFALDVRCFIPFADAAQFDGDNRGFSEARDAASRLSYSVILRPQQGDYLESEIFAGKTQGPYMGFGPRAEGESRPTATITPTRIDGGTRYDIHLAGPNPLVVGAPDIDVHATVQFTQPIPGMLQIKADFKGDQFPAMEAFVTPKDGRAVAIGAYMPPNLALGNLVGDAQRPMSSVKLLASSPTGATIDRIVAGRFSNPSTTIENVAHSTYTAESWSRTVLKVATPDNMPAPQPVWDRPAQTAQPATRANTPNQTNLSTNTGNNAAENVSGPKLGQRP